MDKRKILIQLDTDSDPSVFDRIVAIDAGADEVFSYGGVKPETVREKVHGAIFTRGPKDLAAPPCSSAAATLRPARNCWPRCSGT